jgi:hypothetical protein
VGNQVLEEEMEAKIKCFSTAAMVEVVLVVLILEWVACL